MRVTKVLDFQTGADVAKAEQEGEVVYYGHDSEAGIGVLLDAFKKDFPKIKTSYVRLQTGALYAKITAERSAGRFGVDVLQLSDISPAIDFQKKGGWEHYLSPEYAGYKAEYQSNPPGYYGWGGVSFAGISYNQHQGEAGAGAQGVEGHQQPRSSRTGSAPSWPPPACSTPSGTCCASSTATTSGRNSPSSARAASTRGPSSSIGCPRATTGCARWPSTPATRSSRRKAPTSTSWRRPTGCRPSSFYIGVVNRAPHPEAAKLFVDWALSKRGQLVYQNQKILLYGSLRSDAGPMPTGKRLSDFKLLFPSDWTDYAASHAHVREGVELDHGACEPSVTLRS